MPFVSDVSADGRKFRAWSVVDDFNRECPVIDVDRSLPSERVVRELEQVAQVRGSAGVLVELTRLHGPRVYHLIELTFAPARTLMVSRGAVAFGIALPCPQPLSSRVRSSTPRT